MRLISILMVFSVITGCQTEREYNENMVKNEIQTVFEDFYAKYEGEDFAFTDYYSEDVIRLGPSGKYTEGVENFRNSWKQTIEEDSFDLLGFGEPRFVISREQVVSFNTFDEVFIDPESGDSTRFTGTWVAVWQKQQNDEWKIKMTTWHTD